MKQIWEKSELGGGTTIREYYLQRSDGQFVYLWVYKTLKDEVSLNFGDGEFYYFPNAKEAEKVALAWFYRKGE